MLKKFAAAARIHVAHFCDWFQYIPCIFLMMASGFPYEVVAEGHFVPGPERGESAKFKGKDIWPTIMTVTRESCMTYFQRVHTDFNRAVRKDFSAKTKAR